MENKLIQIRIENAKAYFILSQILIILAGFMFTTSSLHYNYIKQYEQEVMNKLINYPDYETKINYLDNETKGLMQHIYSKNFEQILNDSKNEEKRFFVYLISGILLTIISILFFYFGKNKLKRI